MKNIETQMNREKTYIAVVALIIFSDNLVANISGQFGKQYSVVATVLLVTLAWFTLGMIKNSVTAPILTVEGDGIRVKQPIGKKEKIGTGFIKFEDIKYVGISNVVNDIVISDEKTETIIRIESKEMSKKKLKSLQETLIEKGTDIVYADKAVEIFNGESKMSKEIILMNVALTISILGTITKIIVKFI